MFFPMESPFQLKTPDPDLPTTTFHVAASLTSCFYTKPHHFTAYLYCLPESREKNMIKSKMQNKLYRP